MQYHWMYRFERFLNYLKKKIKNKSRIEGPICEIFQIEETSTFASYYFEVDVQSRRTWIGRNLDDGGVSSSMQYTYYCLYSTFQVDLWVLSKSDIWIKRKL